MRRVSTLATAIVSSYWRAARLDLFRRRWLFPTLVRRILPEPLTCMRRAVALWVLSLGIGSPRPRIVSQSPYSDQEHGVAEAEEPVAQSDGVLIRGEDALSARERRDQQQQ